MTTTPNAYEEKQERRRERLLERADNADREASQRLGTAQRMASVIPFGQPILVGHHSETRDRNYRRKIRNNYDKSREASEKAKRLHDRAASVGKGGISSDDPGGRQEAGRQDRGRQEKLQGFMKRCNAAIRKRKKDHGAAFAAICDEHNLGPDTRADLLKPDSAGRIGFAPYQLSNNNANIRRMKRRVEALRAQAQDETTEQTIGPVRIVENTEENRLQLFFPGQPSDPNSAASSSAPGSAGPAIRAAWQRHRSHGATYWGRELAEQYAKEETAA